MDHPMHEEWDGRELQVAERVYRPKAAEPNASERVLGALEDALARGKEASPLLLACTARRLGMSRRTLQRRLQASRTSYSDLVRRERESRAIHLLSQPEHSLLQIAVALGFSELSAFSRAFKRWTGTSPSRFRHAQLSETIGRPCPAPSAASARQVVG